MSDEPSEPPPPPRPRAVKRPPSKSLGSDLAVRPGFRSPPKKKGGKGKG
jgi:hypothetical protein